MLAGLPGTGLENFLRDAGRDRDDNTWAGWDNTGHTL